MTAFQPQQEKSLIAFITALGQQEESLPPALQAQLHSIGQNLDSRVVELPTIAASLPNLQKAYQEALNHAQSETDDSRAVLVSRSNSDRSSELRDRAIAILTDSNPVGAAQKSKFGSRGQIASNPLKRLFGRG